MTLDQIAQTSQGAMVGDYISTSFTGGRAVPVFAVGRAPGAAAFDEAMYVPNTSLPVATLAPYAASSAGVVPGPGIGETIHALRRD